MRTYRHRRITVNQNNSQKKGSALIKNITLFRGDASEANAVYVPVEYIVKEYASIPDVERTRHAIELPSPPDQWFIKFASGQTGPEFISLQEDLDQQPSTIVDKLGRLLITNRMKLLTNTIYRMQVLVNREESDSGKPLRIAVTPSISELAGYTGATTSIGTQNKIVWEFDTTGIPASKLSEVRFWIDAYEENIDPVDGGAIYISDINLLGTVRELPINTIFRYDGEVWDDSITKLSNDGGIVNGHPHKLVQSYETNSDAVRLYCLSDGDVYTWEIDANDPYVITIDPDDPPPALPIMPTSRIIVSW